jgi:hypothetical protein
MSALKPGLEGSPRASPGVLSMLILKKYFSLPRFSYFFPPPYVKLKWGLKIGGRVLIATNKSNYLANQKHGAINKYDDCIY